MTLAPSKKVGQLPPNPTAASLLGFLHRGPMTGWELARAAQNAIGQFWNITSSHVYRELRNLEAAGLVAAGETGVRDRRPYTITDAGRGVFERWIAQEPGPDIIRSPVLLMVFFGAHLPPALFRRFLTLHRLRHEQLLERYRALADTVGDSDPFAAATVAYGIAHEEAVARWFAGLPWLRDERPPAADPKPA
jgi:DNA-binding PadR family transcriptional regulator